ncbi:MAG: cell division protein FtsA [Tannerellaceae bacterium]|jgi:cell division protein FtsA|nr:cell division protein FtsA [Tannerellaceae bacterium]
MAYTEFIAAIDLGTSRLVGMAGTKNTSTGILSVIACDTEDSDSGIRRGCVVNVEETAAKIKRLVRKLESKLNGARIAKIYIGIGGQSVHSIDHSVIREVAEEDIVTEDLKDLLLEECRTYRAESLDILGIVPPVYYVDGNRVQNPAGVPFRRIEAKYKLIAGRPSLRRHIKACMERTQLKLADILISPLALADVVLSEDEKSLGCALVDFGAGVTSVTIYRKGHLADLCVIPLGGHLITKDLTTLPLIESEAERLKIDYGSAVVGKDEDESVQVSAVDGIGIQSVKLSKVNHVIGSRMKEIVENVYAILEADNLIESLGAGVVITGGASNLRNLAEEMRKRLKKDIRYAALRENLMENTSLAAYSEFAAAIGLLSQGDMNCAQITEQTSERDMFGNEPVAGAEKTNEPIKVKPVKEPVKKPEQKTPKPSKIGSLFDRLGGIFDDNNL